MGGPLSRRWAVVCVKFCKSGPGPPGSSTSVSESLGAVVHELGHYADCRFNKNAIGPEDHSDGCQAEVACLGGSLGDNCPSDRFPRKR